MAIISFFNKEVELEYRNEEIINFLTNVIANAVIHNTSDNSMISPRSLITVLIKSFNVMDFYPSVITRDSLIDFVTIIKQHLLDGLDNVQRQYREMLLNVENDEIITDDDNDFKSSCLLYLRERSDYIIKEEIRKMYYYLDLLLRPSVLQTAVDNSLPMSSM